jgi:hypothetical protein
MTYNKNDIVNDSNSDDSDSDSSNKFDYKYWNNKKYIIYNVLKCNKTK